MAALRTNSGMLKVRITCADVQVCLSKLAFNNIKLKEICNVDELNAEVLIHRSSLKHLTLEVVRFGGTVKVLKKIGLYWWLAALKKHPFFIIGLILYICLVMYIPTRVFFINVEGNEFVSKAEIVDAVQKAGIEFGTRRRSVRNEKVKNELLVAIPGLQWVGVNTKGCVATISVKERNVAERDHNKTGISSIVAARDGIIDSVVVTRGNVLCKVGQAVVENQMLVSGYTDCGITIKATSAEAEIYARTTRLLDVVLPLEHIVRGREIGREQKFSIIFGKKQINLYKDSGIPEGSYGKMYSKYILTLPGGFQLPLSVEKETTIRYECRDDTLQDDTARAIVISYAQLYLERFMIAGNILHSSKDISINNNLLEFRGQYLCREMIGKVYEEEIITADE